MHVKWRELVLINHVFTHSSALSRTLANAALTALHPAQRPVETVWRSHHIAAGCANQPSAWPCQLSIAKLPSTALFNPRQQQQLRPIARRSFFDRC